jgi:hypothetical protein
MKRKITNRKSMNDTGIKVSNRASVPKNKSPQELIKILRDEFKAIETPFGVNVEIKENKNQLIIATIIPNIEAISNVGALV